MHAHLVVAAVFKDKPKNSRNAENRLKQGVYWLSRDSENTPGMVISSCRRVYIHPQNSVHPQPHLSHPRARRCRCGSRAGCGRRLTPHPPVACLLPCVRHRAGAPRFGKPRAIAVPCRPRGDVCGYSISSSASGARDRSSSRRVSPLA